MYHVKRHKNKITRRKIRVRKKIYGVGSKPRMSVFRSNRYIYVQMIDDDKGITIVEASSLNLSPKNKSQKKVEQALEVGKNIAKKAIEKGIKEAVFDRNGYKYHGRVKAVAEGAREGGLNI